MGSWKRKKSSKLLTFYYEASNLIPGANHMLQVLPHCLTLLFLLLHCNPEQLNLLYVITANKIIYDFWQALQQESST